MHNILLKFKIIHLESQVYIYNIPGFKNPTKENPQETQEFLSQSE